MKLAPGLQRKGLIFRQRVGRTFLELDCVHCGGIVIRRDAHFGRNESCGCLIKLKPGMTRRGLTLLRMLEGDKAEVQCHYCQGIKVIWRTCFGTNKGCGCQRTGNRVFKPGLRRKDLILRRILANRRGEVECARCGNIVDIHLANFGKQNACKKCGDVATGAKLRREETPFNAAYNACRKRAKESNIPFALSKVSFVRLVTRECAYCGCPPITRRNHRRDFPRNGLDRVDNEGPYAVHNVVPCCPTCNWWKLDYGFHQFTDWLTRMKTVREGKPDPGLARRLTHAVKFQLLWQTFEHASIEAAQEIMRWLQPPPPVRVIPQSAQAPGP